jgi:hypothetical protein
LIAVGSMAELRALPKEGRDDAGGGESRLEDIFLSLTGGAEDAAIAEVLR